MACASCSAGTPGIAAASLQALLKRRHESVPKYLPRDKPVGRKRITHRAASQTPALLKQELPVFIAPCAPD